MKTTKKIIALSLAGVLSLFSLPTIRAGATENVDPGAIAGEASLKATHIKNFEDFRAFAENCRRDEWSNGKEFVLDNDITFDSDKMIMVASFAGTFDGNGHTISNVKIEGVASNTGLFGIVYASGVVKNLTVKGTYEPTGVMSRLGGIAGANHGLIQNCTFDGSINADSMMGGICGYNWSDGRIINCTSKGTISGANKIGGIAGVNDGIMSGCVNSAEVNTTYDEKRLSNNMLSNIIESYTMSGDFNMLNVLRDRIDVGGIAGVSAGRIENSTNEGNVGYRQVGYNTGGIAGRSMGFISNSVNRAEVYGRTDTGGIVGQQAPYTFLDYSDSDLKEIESGLNELNSTVNAALKDVSGYSTKIRNELIGIANTIDHAKELLKLIMETLGDGIDDISKSAGSLIDDGTDAVDEIDDQMGDIRADLKSLVDRLHELGVDKDQAFDAIEMLLTALTLSDSDGLEEAYDQLSDALSDIGDSVILDTLADLGDSVSEESDFFEDLKKAGNTLNDINSRMSRLNNDLLSVGNDFFSTITLLVSQIKQFSNTLDSSVQGVAKSLENVAEKGSGLAGIVSGSFSDITSSLAGTLADSLFGSAYNDASGEDIENAVFGRTTNSTNYGVVNGDNNTGGVAGNMGIEADIGMHPDISDTVIDDAALSADYSTMKSRCLIDHCINRGEIEARQSKAGAIAGNMDRGLITDCESYGKLTVLGNYAGGITGFSRAEVRNSYSKLTMYGTRYVGGITGYGTTIHDCISIADIVEAEQFIGAVAGNVEEVNSDKIYNNLYYSEDRHGIDGISYSGIAEGKSFNELVSTERLPKGFSDMTLTFQADGKTVKTLTFAYGSTISSSDIPAVPKKDGFRGVWSKTDFSTAVRDEVITAEYTRINSLLQSDLLRSGRPVLLTMGEFAPGEKLNVTEQKPESELYDYQYHVVIPEDGLSSHQLRYLPQNEGVSIYYLLNDNIGRDLLMKKAGSFGKYATIDVTGNDINVAIIEINENLVVLIIFLMFAIPIAIATIVIILIVRHILKKKKKKAQAKA